MQMQLALDLSPFHPTLGFSIFIPIPFSRCRLTVSKILFNETGAGTCHVCVCFFRDKHRYSWSLETLNENEHSNLSNLKSYYAEVLHRIEKRDGKDYVSNDNTVNYDISLR